MDAASVLGNAKSRTPQVLAIAMAREAERILTLYVLQPAFRRALLSGKLDFLSERERVAARYLLYLASGVVETSVSGGGHVRLFMSEVASGVLAQAGTTIGDSAWRNVVEGAIPLAHRDVKAFAATESSLRKMLTALTRAAAEATDTLDTANEYISGLRRSLRARRTQ